MPVEITFGRQTGLKQLAGLQQFTARRDRPFGILVNAGRYPRSTAGK